MNFEKMTKKELIAYIQGWRDAVKATPYYWYYPYYPKPFAWYEDNEDNKDNKIIWGDRPVTFKEQISGSDYSMYGDKT